MPQRPAFEFSEEELESSIDAFRYASAPRAQRLRRKPIRLQRPPRSAQANGPGRQQPSSTDDSSRSSG